MTFYLSTVNTYEKIQHSAGNVTEEHIELSLRKLLLKDSIKELVLTNDQVGISSTFEIKIYAVPSYTTPQRNVCINEKQIHVTFLNNKQYEKFVSSDGTGELDISINGEADTNRWYCSAFNDVILKSIRSFLWAIEEDFIVWCTASAHHLGEEFPVR